MALTAKNLRRVSHGGVATDGVTNSIWHLASNDADTVIEAANYFDAFAGEMSVGDIILASVDLDGTPEMKHYMVTAIAAGVVTVAIQSVT